MLVSSAACVFCSSQGDVLRIEGHEFLKVSQFFTSTVL
jgi:hypothetical protein